MKVYNTEVHNKYKQWVVTIKTRVGQTALDLPPAQTVAIAFKALGDTHTFQLEESSNGMWHYQCCLTTKIRKMQSTLLNDLQVELDYPRELLQVDRSMDYEAAVKYCSDKHKRAAGTDLYTTVSSLKYDDSDILFLDNPKARYLWQNKFMETFFDESEVNLKTPDDRTVYWVQDPTGNSGKSKFSKWLVRRNNNITKIAFGSSNQLRSSVISEGIKDFYILDIPRTLGDDDSINSVVSVIEDIKNGYVKSGMYGESKELFLKPPHILVFTNKVCPITLLSKDRWQNYCITPLKDWHSL